LVNDRS